MEETHHGHDPTRRVRVAGGEGSRLRPYTQTLPKPALPFAGHCRIIDFALSNLVNSSAGEVFVLLQYKPSALVEHIAAHWSGLPGGARIQPVLPAQPFLGTADAVRQNLALLGGRDPEAVAVFAADHVYRMDVVQMRRFHRGCAADATVAARPVPLAEVSRFGVIEAGGDGRVLAFQEKPAAPRCCPHDDAAADASMGNYLFRPEVLRSALREAERRGGHDFGRDVIPLLVDAARLYAYDFRENRVPGIRPWEERGYRRDIGTVAAYRAAQDDVAGAFPRFDLDNAAWPIRGGIDDRRSGRPGLAVGRGAAPVRIGGRHGEAAIG